LFPNCAKKSVFVDFVWRLLNSKFSPNYVWRYQK